MANSKITWANKESLVTDPTIAEKNKVTDSNMNEIKSVVNENADQVILSDTEPTSNDNEIWVDTSSNATYMNQEVNIGTTNVSNTPVWFKQGKNLLNIRNQISNTANTFEILADDWMHYVNSSGSAEQVVFPKISVKPNTKYSIFVETKDVTGSPFVILATYNNNTRIDTTYPNTSKVITTGSNINFLQFSITTSGMNTTGNYKIRIMVTKNTEIDDEYEPYVQKAININGKDEYYTNDYSTAEQVIGKWLGNTLYRKTINFGALPNNSSKQVAINVTNFDKLVNLYGVAYSTGYTMLIPFIHSDTTNIVNVYFNNGTKEIGVATHSDRSGYTESYITIEYTKTTD